MANRILNIEHDDDHEYPMDWDGSWTLISFNHHSRHEGNLSAYMDYVEVDDPENPGETIEVSDFDEGTKKKIEDGLAFFLYESHDEYHLQGIGEIPDDWESSRSGGFLIWENPADHMGAKTPMKRQQDAQCFLDTYNKWKNGEVYGFTLTDQFGDELDALDSCWGFYEFSSMLEHFNNLKSGDNLVVNDDYNIFDEKELKEKFPGVNIVDRFTTLDAQEDDKLLRDILNAMKSCQTTMSLCDMEHFIPIIEKRLKGITFEEC